MIPSFELRTQYQEIKQEILDTLARVLDKGQFILGPEVEAFESEFAAWNGSRHAIGVASGTDALHLALKAMNIGPNDEVICPPFTYMATASAVSLTGARPVFVDIEPGSFTLDVSKVEAAVTSRTKAVIAVHLYGQPADLQPLKDLCQRRKIGLIEDCAQSTGAAIGSLKVGNLGDIGDGGMMTTQSAETANVIKQLRQQGQGPIKYHHETLGTNSRLDEMQAAVLRIKLRHLDRWNNRRRAIADMYGEHCKNPAVTLPRETPGTTHVYHQYTLRCQDRDGLMGFLKERQIGCTVYYPLCLHLQPAYRSLGYHPGSFPHSELAQEQALSLPMYPELNDDAVQEICQALNQFQPSLSTAG